MGLLGGTGRSGPGLALRWSRAGHEVLLGSRDVDRARIAARTVADRAGGDANRVAGDSNATVADLADIVVLTVPYSAQASLLAPLAGPLQGKIVVSTVVPVLFDATGAPQRDPAAGESAALEAQALLAGSRIVAALHTVSSSILRQLSRAIDADVAMCGDDSNAVAATGRLVEQLPGARAIPAGGIRSAHFCEDLAILLLAINREHGGHAGVRFTDLRPPPHPTTSTADQ